MKRRMEQLMNGRFEYEVPKLVLSEEKIAVNIKSGENYRGELFLVSADNRRIKGMVMSSNRRVIVGKEKFSGLEVCIPYAIDGRGLLPGDCIEAWITINSSLGEYQVPVSVRMEQPQIYTSTGEIRNLDDFVALAEQDYREAFRLFTRDVFLKILNGEDEQYLGLYHAMSQNPITYQDMEEFLIAAGKKEPVHIVLEQDEKTYTAVSHTLKDVMYIKKSGWGFLSLEVETKGSFLKTEKKIITSDDFIGSICEVEYYVKKERLGVGKTYGQILIHGVYETLVFPIVTAQADEYFLNTHLFEKKMQVDLARRYQKYCLGELTMAEWGQQSLELLQQLNDAGCCYPKHRLMESYIRYRMGDIPGAMSKLWPLRDVAFGEDQMEEEGAYLWLAKEIHVITEDQRESAQDRVELLHQRKPDSFLLAEVYMQLTEHGKNSLTRRLYIYEEVFQRGACSPFLYHRALGILEQDINQFKKLSPFMVQVLSYAAKHGRLTQEMTMRMGHLSEYVKQYQKNVYELLVCAYERFPEAELLHHICKYIMKGQPGKKEYFRWYSLAVEQDLRITRLYEYYIETMPEGYQEVLPQVIRMYFVYNNTLSSKKRAMVYANVIRNKEMDRGTYQNYKKSMEQFALESVREGRMNEDYAAVYQECLGTLSNRETAEALARVMFTYRIFCDDSKIRSVIVYHEPLRQEMVYPCKDGVAYISLYTSDANIIFEDGKHRRYAATVDYNLQKLMNEKIYQKQCLAFGVSDCGLLTAVCEDKEGITNDTLTSFQMAAQMEEFKAGYRHKICKSILQYYAQHAQDTTLDAYLRKMDHMTFAKVNKALLVEILIDRVMYDKAFEILQTYGYEDVKTDHLMKLASRLILQREFVEEEELVYLALHVFEEGLYDEVILTYLSDNLLGSVAQMVTLWERMKGFQMDTYSLEEEIMLLAMFGRVYLKQGHEILRSYVQQGGKQQVILAYVSLWSYDYFLGKKETDPYIFECLEICLERKWEVDRICRLALLQYYAGKRELSKQQQGYVRRILKECSEAGLRFAFFRTLPDTFIKPYQLDDKQFIEERFPAKARVTICYQIQKDNVSISEKKMEPMKNMYQGIFVKEFLLFYGESLRYYLLVEEEDNVYQTEETVLEMEEIQPRGNSKYQLMNQMLIGRKLGQDKKTEEAMEQYLKGECVVDRLFRLME